MTNFPSVAIIGRMNVGKSSLFNRLIEKSKAITSSLPGTTRDILSGTCIWRGRNFTVLDTGGLDIEARGEIERNVIRQAKHAMEDADIIMLVIDLKIGLLPQEKKIIETLQKTKKPIIIAANKADSPKIRKKTEEIEIQRFGKRLRAKIFPVSAANGSGIGDLLDEVFKQFSQSDKKLPVVREPEAIKVAIIGKPNVGKSSLLNALVGEERAITSKFPHTTREPKDTLINYKSRLFLLIDTVGLRRKAKAKLEALGIKKTIQRLENADMSLLVLDVSEPLGTGDKRLAGLIIEKGAGLLLVVNKIDLVEQKKNWKIQYKTYLKAIFPFVTWAPILFVSAKSGEGVKEIFGSLIEVKQAQEKIIEEKILNEVLGQITAEQKPIKARGTARPRIYGIKQIGVSPPTFRLFIKEKTSLAPTYLKFIEKRIREKLGFEGTPIRIRCWSIKI